jgi:hypothetical protein
MIPFHFLKHTSPFMINEEEPQQHHHEITREGCRRNTIGTPEELSSSSGNDEFENELYRSRSWYGGFIVDSLKSNNIIYYVFI